MKIIKYTDEKPVQELPGVLKRVVIGPDDSAPNFIMRVFDIDPGASTLFHTHAWEHELYVLEGKGVAVSDKGETAISRDSVIYVPGNEKHCFKADSKQSLRLICVIPKVS